jgi:pyruvate dehydrogenase E1 component
MMEEAFRLIDDPNGESTYLRLSTRSVVQPDRADDSWRDDALKGGYWLKEPGPNAEAAILAMGALMPEALARGRNSAPTFPDSGYSNVTSPDLLHRGWTAAQAARWGGAREPSHIEQLLSRLAPRAGLVTLCDAAPASLSWLGGVLGQRVAPLGVERFGQTGNLQTSMRLTASTATAITEGLAELLLPQTSS